MKGASIKAYLFAGVVVWVPILVTFALIRFIVDLLDKTVSLLPNAYQPEQLLGMRVPGFGVLLSLALLLTTGIIVTNFLGQRIVIWSESLLDKIPLVRTIYNATKQVIQAMFSTNGQAFRKVLLVEYPRKGMWSIAFQTGVADEKITRHTKQEMISLFIPTTPNPTSGFLMMMAKQDVVEISMSVDEALAFIISLGVMKSPSSASVVSNIGV